MKTDTNQIQTGWVLLVASKSFLSKAIQDFEKCSYSHAAMFIRLDNGITINGVFYPIGLYVAEMVAKGLVLTDFDTYISGNDILLICKPNYAVDGNAYMTNIISMIGHEKYGFVNLLLCQPIKFLTGFRLWFGDVDDNNPPRLICGEFVEEQINKQNPAYFTDWMRSAPSDIFNSSLFTQIPFIRN